MTVVFGCPAFVLDPRLQDGHKIPQWKTRSRRGMYLGPSPQHATSVPRILNLDTHRITNQFHVVFDDRFTTVSSESKVLYNSHPQWTSLLVTRFLHPFDSTDDIPELDSAWSVDKPNPTFLQHREHVRLAQDQHHHSLPNRSHHEIADSTPDDSLVMAHKFPRRLPR